MLKPLFMWAGGKTKMIPKYTERLGLPRDFNLYSEPFFGGGAMFCTLHNEGLLENCTVILNDANLDLINLYRTIRDDCEGFIYTLKLIEDRYLKMNYAKRKEHYYLVRNAYAFEGFDTLLDPATLLFLLKTGFNGIYQTMEGSDRFASPCGLLNQTNLLFDYDLIREWSKVLKTVTLYSQDWKQIVVSGQYVNWFPKGKVFYFMDPPYRDSFKHYGVDEFDHDALITEARKLAQEDAIVWLCNRWTDDTYYEDRVGPLKIDVFDVTYTAGRRKKNEDGTHSAVAAKEVLIHNGEK